MAAPLILKDHRGESQVYVERAGIGAGILVLLLVVLISRMAYLQIFLHESFVTRSDENRIQIQPRAPVRGLVFDRHGVLIANNSTSHDLNITTERTESIEDLLLSLEPYVAISEEQKQAFLGRLKGNPDHLKRSRYFFNLRRRKLLE